MERSITIAAGAAILVPLAIYGWSVATSHQRQKLPPFAMAGFFETLQAISEFRLMELWLETAKKVGNNFQLLIPPIPPYLIVVGDPDLILEISLDKHTRKPGKFFKSVESIFGSSIVTESDHSIWKPIRKGVAPAFSSYHIGRMNKVCSEHTKRWMKERLEPMIDEGVAFDPAKEMLIFSVKVICEAAFEFKPATEKVEKYLHELNLFAKEFGLKSAFNPLRPYLRSVLPEVRRAYQAAEWIKNFCAQVLELHQSNPHPTSGTVVELIATNPHYPNDSGRISDINMFLIAGHDTTAYSLAWILIDLAKNPEEQTKLREALKEQPESAWVNVPALQNVIRESMRIHPVVAGGPLRCTGRDFVAKDGTVIPSGADVFLAQIIPNRDPGLFDDPDEFIPSRWEKGDANASVLLPFAVGPRNCVGQGLAKAELNSLVSQLIGKYRFTLVDEGHPEYFATYKPVGSKIMAHRLV